jgi:hypothetical protein
MSGGSNSNAEAGGLAIFPLVGLIFIILKLTGAIGWSWWWVTVPFWGLPVLGGGLVIAGMILYVIFSFFGLVFSSLALNVANKTLDKKKKEVELKRMIQEQSRPYSADEIPSKTTTKHYL